MMYPLRKEPEQGKRALLAFFIDGRHRASHPKAASARSLGGADFFGLNLRGHLLANTDVRGFRQIAGGGGRGEKKPGPPQEYELLAQNLEGLQQMVPEVIEAIPTRPVAEEVIQRLGLRMESAELLENLRVEEDPGTMFISLSYMDTDPERAQRIANTVAEVASEKIRPEVRFGPFEYPFESHLGIHVWERASVPTTPVSPDPLRNGLLALVLGLAAGIGLALLMERRAT